MECWSAGVWQNSRRIAREAIRSAAPGEKGHHRMKRNKLVMSLWKFGRNLALTCGVTGSAFVASAQTNLTPLGGEYAIAGNLPGDQLLPAAAINTGGGFLVWQDNSVTTNGLRIQAESLGGNLISSGAPFVVSAVSKSKTTGDQEKARVALIQNNGAVVVWQGGKSGHQQIFARFMDSTGMFLTKDVRVSAFSKI